MTENLTTRQVVDYFVDSYVGEHEHGWGKDAFENAAREARDLFFSWLEDHEDRMRVQGARRAANFLESNLQGRKRLPGNPEVRAYEDGMREAVRILRSLR